MISIFHWTKIWKWIENWSERKTRRSNFFLLLMRSSSQMRGWRYHKVITYITIARANNVDKQKSWDDLPRFSWVLAWQLQHSEDCSSAAAAYLTWAWLLTIASFQNWLSTKYLIEPWRPARRVQGRHDRPSSGSRHHVCFSYATELSTVRRARSWTERSRGWNHQESYCTIKSKLENLVVFESFRGL